jgi:hypothetical protein
MAFELLNTPFLLDSRNPIAFILAFATFLSNLRVLIYLIVNYDINFKE